MFDFLTEREPTYFEYARKVLAEGNLLALNTQPRFMSLDEFETAVATEGIE